MGYPMGSTLVGHSVRIVTGIAPNVASFRWTISQIRSIRHKVHSEGVAARVPFPAVTGPRGWWGVRAAIALLKPTCLERALVLQAWIGGYADPPDVVIGVRRRAGAVEAHAWLDGVDPWFDPSYHEIARFDA